MGEEGAVTLEELANGLAVITIDRPKALNAANVKMVSEFRKALSTARDSATCKAVVLQGAGEKGFCSGGDMKGVTTRLEEDKDDENIVSAREQFFEEYNAIYEFTNFPKPTVALAHGITMGFGMGISTNATISVATEKSRFAMPENNIGLFPDAGFTHNATKLAPGVGRLMGLTACHFIGAGDVLKAGLATHYMPFEKFPGLIKALSEADFAGSSAATAVVRTVVEGLAESAPEPKLLNSDGLALAADVANAKTLKDAYSTLETAAAINESWASSLVPAMKKGSPFSQALIFKLLLLGEANTPFTRGIRGPRLRGMQGALEREYVVASRIIARPDFKEGVRAVLVDKDQNAKWIPATPDEVDAKELDQMLKPYPKDSRNATLGLAKASALPAVAVPVDPTPEGAIEMKVTAKKGSGFYIRAATNLLQGMEARPAKEGKEALEAKPPADALRISGLGDSIDAAIAAATVCESQGLCKITRIQTAYPVMETQGREGNCSQILIDVKRISK